jgi:hypothetical protein
MNRRTALRAGAAAFGVPWQRILAATTPALPDTALFERDPESYWKRIRDEQFYLPAGRSFLNNGSLGVAPRPVLAAVADYLEKGAALETADPYPRWGYETMDAHREELARFVGCTKDEIALMHNATEANTTVAAGLDLKAGDEVVMTDQEHPSGRAGWRLKEARYGVTVREVKIPLPPKSPAQLADLLVSSIGPRTAVLMFSGMTSPTGLIMPIREISDAARAKGVITMVDGAHMHGQMPLASPICTAIFSAAARTNGCSRPPDADSFISAKSGWTDCGRSTSPAPGTTNRSRPAASCAWAPTIARCSKACWPASSSRRRLAPSGSTRASINLPAALSSAPARCRTSNC